MLYDASLARVEKCVDAPSKVFRRNSHATKFSILMNIGLCHTQVFVDRSCSPWEEETHTNSHATTRTTQLNHLPEALTAYKEAMSICQDVLGTDGSGDTLAGFFSSFPLFFSVFLK